MAARGWRLKPAAFPISASPARSGPGPPRPRRAGRRRVLSLSRRTLLFFLPLVGRVAHGERSERCDGWGVAHGSAGKILFAEAAPTRPAFGRPPKSELRSSRPPAGGGEGQMPALGGRFIFYKTIHWRS